MARKRPVRGAGTTVILEHSSKVLAENPLGDPHVRDLQSGCRRSTTGAQRSRCALSRAGRHGGIHRLRSRASELEPFSENLAERAARLIQDKRMGPVILVMPDCFTSLGGNQYVNSSAIGRYADYLVDEIVPFVDREFRTLASREHRGCFGKSSGGYGAIIHGMRYTRHWGAIATIRAMPTSSSSITATGPIRSTCWPSTASRRAGAGRQTAAELARGNGR